MHADSGEPQLRVARAPEPVRGGAVSARFELQKSDPVINNGTRAELTAPFEPVGAERWYGFSVYLPTSWAYDQSAEIVTQWHQHWDVGSSPPLALVTRKGNWEISQNWEGYEQQTVVGTYQTGRWTDWVFHVKWSAGADGVVQIWKDGQPVAGFGNRIGKNTYQSSYGNYMKIGIYKWDWSQGNPSDTVRRVMYHDELRVADGSGSYEAVAPGTPAPAGHLALTGGLSISPANPTAGQPTTASFVVTNDGGSPVSVPYFLAGARDQANANRDFPASPAVTLQPGQSYTYQQSRTLAAGTYTAWPAYYDGTTWRELGNHTSFAVATGTPSTDPVLVGAGDIASCGSSGDEATASLLDGISGTVFTAGDNAYPNGSATDSIAATSPLGVGTRRALVPRRGTMNTQLRAPVASSITSARAQGIHRKASTPTT
jgi:hypothetical protein